MHAKAEMNQLDMWNTADGDELILQRIKKYSLFLLAFSG